MSTAAIGAKVLYGNHSGWFVADIYRIGNACVVRAGTKKVTAANLVRDRNDEATHHLTDFPAGGFWRPEIGVFVVPHRQVTVIKKSKASAR